MLKSGEDPVCGCRSQHVAARTKITSVFLIENFVKEKNCGY